MSSHSTDVYVIEDSTASEYSSAVQQISPHDGGGEDVDSSQRISTESCGSEESGEEATARIYVDVGTNTEGLSEPRAKEKVHAAVSELIDTIGQGAIRNDISKRDCNDAGKESRNIIIETQRYVSMQMGMLAKRPLPPVEEERTPRQTHECSQGNEPEWLCDIQAAIERVHDTFLEFGQREVDIPMRNSSPTVAQLSPAVETSRTFLPCDNVAVATHRVDENESIQQLRSEIQTLQEGMAEVHMIMCKEGVSSILPLYNELLSLREMARKEIVKDAVAVRSLLMMQEDHFRQQLGAAQKGMAYISRELNRKCCGSTESLVGTLVNDVEKLQELGCQLKRLREEHRGIPSGTDQVQHAASAMGPPNKKRRTSDDGFKPFLARLSQLGAQVATLQQEVETRKGECAKWRERYEFAIRSADVPQNNDVFNSLLDEVKRSLLEESKRKNASLCRLFGWNLLKLDGNTVSIALLGSSNTQLSLPLPEYGCEERSSLATGIVLARKVIEGRGTACDPQPEVFATPTNGIETATAVEAQQETGVVEHCRNDQSYPMPDGERGVEKAVEAADAGAGPSRGATYAVPEDDNQLEASPGEVVTSQDEGGFYEGKLWED